MIFRLPGTELETKTPPVDALPEEGSKQLKVHFRPPKATIASAGVGRRNLQLAMRQVTPVLLLPWLTGADEVPEDEDVIRALPLAGKLAEGTVGKVLDEQELRRMPKESNLKPLPVLRPPITDVLPLRVPLPTDAKEPW